MSQPTEAPPARGGAVSEEPVPFVYELSPGFARYIEGLALRAGASETDLLTRAFALYAAALQAKQQGKRLAILDPDGQVEREIVGI